MMNHGLDPTLFDEEYFNSETLQMSELEIAEMNILPCEVSQIVPFSFIQFQKYHQKYHQVANCAGATLSSRCFIY